MSRDIRNKIKLDAANKSESLQCLTMPFQEQLGGWNVGGINIWLFVIVKPILYSTAKNNTTSCAEAAKSLVPFNNLHVYTTQPLVISGTYGGTWQRERASVVLKNRAHYIINRLGSTFRHTKKYDTNQWMNIHENIMEYLEMTFINGLSMDRVWICI